VKVRRTWLVLAVSAALGLTTIAGTGGSAGAAASSGKTLTIGYSAWPGWFPLAVAEKEGIFDQVGLKVKLKYFADYIGSLDAMSAGRLDANTQTLNDTMAGVASGSKQSIVVVNDNSAGNDAIICDKSVGNTIQDLKGKTIAAEEGVVDHFLLLQGLASVGLTQSDINFRGVLTDAAAGAFAGGQFDCVGVFAPFTLQALERPGSHVVFSSKDFPGSIPDHIVVASSLVKDNPGEVQKLVDAWYKTLDYIAAHPQESIDIMAAKAELSAADYEKLAEGTKIFTVDDALAAFKDGTTSTSLLYTARQINPFLVKSGLTKQKASLKGLFVPKFTQAYADSVAAP
jgi:NitT/TauT family transport system substrate-binding protein